MNSSNTNGETGAFLPEEHHDIMTLKQLLLLLIMKKRQVIYGEENVVRRAL
jgi:hypothetical protein